MVDFGDAPVVPYEVERSRAAIESTVARGASRAGRDPARPRRRSLDHPRRRLRACAKGHGPLGSLHFDAHTDTAPESYLHTDNHGTMMRALVDRGPHRSRAGTSRSGSEAAGRSPRCSPGRRKIGITPLHAPRTSRTRGIDDVIREAIGIVGDRGRVPQRRHRRRSTRRSRFRPGLPSPAGSSRASCSAAVRARERGARVRRARHRRGRCRADGAPPTSPRSTAAGVAAAAVRGSQPLGAGARVHGFVAFDRGDPAMSLTRLISAAPADRLRWRWPPAAGTMTTTRPRTSTPRPPRLGRGPARPTELETLKPDTLTVATDSPAFPPYFEDDDPTNGKGFESAVAYAIANELGYTEDQVEWVVEPFNRRSPRARRTSTSTSTRSRSPRSGPRRSTSPRRTTRRTRRSSP